MSFFIYKYVSVIQLHIHLVLSTIFLDFALVFNRKSICLFDYFYLHSMCRYFCETMKSIVTSWIFKLNDIFATV